MHRHLRSLHGAKRNAGAAYPVSRAVGEVDPDFAFASSRLQPNAHANTRRAAEPPFCPHAKCAPRSRDDGDDPQRARLDDDDLVVDDEILEAAPGRVDFHDRGRDRDQVNRAWHHGADADVEVHAADTVDIATLEHRLAHLGALLGAQRCRSGAALTGLALAGLRSGLALRCGGLALLRPALALLLGSRLALLLRFGLAGLRLRGIAIHLARAALAALAGARLAAGTAVHLAATAFHLRALAGGRALTGSAFGAAFRPALVHLFGWCCRRCAAAGTAGPARAPGAALHALGGDRDRTRRQGGGRNRGQQCLPHKCSSMPPSC